MKTIDISELQSNFDKYINIIEGNKQESFIVLKNGKPVAMIVPFSEKKTRRIGIAKGYWRDVSDDEFNDSNICSLFLEN